jgi:hypothetical protein
LTFPRGLLIAGEAGVGKTTLWGEAARGGQERGWCVLSRPATPLHARGVGRI